MSFDTVLVIGPIIYFALLLGIAAGITIISAFLMRVSRFGLALRRKTWQAEGPRFESASALLSVDMLWFVATVL